MLGTRVAPRQSACTRISPAIAAPSRTANPLCLAPLIALTHARTHTLTIQHNIDVRRTSGSSLCGSTSAQTGGLGARGPSTRCSAAGDGRCCRRHRSTRALQPTPCRPCRPSVTPQSDGVRCRDCARSRSRSCVRLLSCPSRCCSACVLCVKRSSSKLK